MNKLRELLKNLTPVQRQWSINIGFGLILAGLMIVGYIYIIDKPKIRNMLEQIKDCPGYNLIVNESSKGKITFNNEQLFNNPEFLCCYGCREKKFKNYTSYEDDKLSQCYCDKSFELWTQRKNVRSVMYNT